MSDKSDELHAKFRVDRRDGRDKHGGDREDARYFVLDYVHDPYARRALEYYAFLCHNKLPGLSQDLWVALRDTYKEEFSDMYKELLNENRN